MKQTVEFCSIFESTEGCRKRIRECSSRSRASQFLNAWTFERSVAPTPPSLGEREHGLPTQEHSRLRSKMFTLQKSAAVPTSATRAQKLAMPLPLPEGEGWGEGEESVQVIDAAHRMKCARLRGL